MAKRIASSSVDWALLNKYVHAESKPLLMQLKNKSDKFYRKVTVLPAELPKIDWDSYKQKIAKPGMLDTFQKSYTSMQIPYPADGGLIATVDQGESKALKIYKEEQNKASALLKELEEKLKKLSSEKKPSEMTMDEFMIKYPGKLDFNNKLFPVTDDQSKRKECDTKSDDSH